ncbi:MAG: class II aldolase/adducin family protein [Bacillota bacterium]
MMQNTDRGLRVKLIEAARRMNASGINQGKSGNVSVRVEGGFIVTPTGVPYEHLGVPDIVFMRQDGEREGNYPPSSEWRLHRDIYATHAEAGAIVHSHPPYATTIACHRRSIPAFHYEVAFAGGRDIRCAEYATFGTQELSDRALEALAGRHACLMANHGIVALGTDLQDAFGMAEKVEALARMYWQALQMGEPKLLDDAEMDRVVERFKTYGR